MKPRYFIFRIDHSFQNSEQINTLIYRYTELQDWNFLYGNKWLHSYSSPAELGIENWEDYELSDDDAMLELL